MQRALYRLEDQLFYYGALLSPGPYARLCLFCSRTFGSAGDYLGGRSRFVRGA